MLRYRKGTVNLGFWIVKTKSKYSGVIVNIFKHRFFIGKICQNVN